MIFIKSIIVGIFAVFPGVSGSTLAISFNLYDRFFISIKNISNNKRFLLMFISGIITGVFLGSNIILYITRYKIILYYLLIGIIISEIPLILKKINNNGKILYMPIILSFLFSILTNYFSMSFLNNTLRTIKLFLGGLFFSFGKIFPGISSSFFLISLGIYKEILSLTANPLILINKYTFYFPFILGVILGIILFIKILSYMIENKYNLLYCIILGFIISSVFILFPKPSFNFENILGFILMIISFLLSYKFKNKP